MTFLEELVRRNSEELVEGKEEVCYSEVGKVIDNTSSISDKNREFVLDFIITSLNVIKKLPDRFDESRINKLFSLISNYLDNVELSPFHKAYFLSRRSDVAFILSRMCADEDEVINWLRISYSDRRFAAETLENRDMSHSAYSFLYAGYSMRNIFSLCKSRESVKRAYDSFSRSLELFDILGDIRMVASANGHCGEIAYDYGLLIPNSRFKEKIKWGRRTVDHTQRFIDFFKDDKNYSKIVADSRYRLGKSQRFLEQGLEIRKNYGRNGKNKILRKS
jgi:hypothetical protein